MNRSFGYAVLLCLLVMASVLNAEIRALWVTPWDITSAQAVDKVVSDAAKAGQTDLLVEVRYRADALYTPNRQFSDYQNNEPRSYMLADDDYDPLADILRKAKSKRLRVHAWVVVFNATPTLHSLVINNYIYQNHYDWITYDAKNRKMNSSENFGYFIDPGIPAVQDYVLEVLSDLVQNYPQLDGLHLDYIRYPNSSWGFHPISLQRWENHQNQYGNISWDAWRSLQITSFVEKCYHRMKKINPSLVLSAAVFADYDAATKYYAQDWKDWLQKGIIDILYPMAYNTKYSEFIKQLNFIKTLEQDDRFIIGLRAWDQNGGSLLPTNSKAYHGYTILDIEPRINQTRAGKFGGVALFSYGDLKKGNAWDELVNMSYNAALLAEVDAQNEQFMIDIDPRDLNNNFAADVKISPSGRQYVLGLLIPQEGSWTWELWDSSNQMLYKRSRFYPKGPVKDIWNGSVEAQKQVDAGEYVIRIYPEHSSYKYYIPITLQGISR